MLFSGPYFGPDFFSESQTDPCFQNKNCGCRLTGQLRYFTMVLSQFVNKIEEFRPLQTDKQKSKPIIAIFQNVVSCGSSSSIYSWFIKFIYSEKATKFCQIYTLILSYVVPVKSKVTISQNFVAFSEYMNFNLLYSGLKFEWTP